MRTDLSEVGKKDVLGVDDGRETEREPVSAGFAVGASRGKFIEVI